MSVSKILFIIILSLIVCASMYAQDTVKVENQNSDQQQEKEKTQQGTKFVDEAEFTPSGRVNDQLYGVFVSVLFVF